MIRYKILGQTVCFSDYSYFVDKIISNSKKNRLFKVAPVASHPLVKAHYNGDLKRALAGFDMVLPDGQSLVWAANKLYRADIKERIYGPELFLRVAERCQSEKIRIILYGNHTEALKRQLTKKYKKLSVVALDDLREKRVDKIMTEGLIKKIRNYRNSVLFIGIGSPAQHYLLNDLEGIKMPVVAVGAAFDFLAGIKKQAPDWIQNAKLEWFYRLCSEPARLWPRYLVDAPTFVLLVMMQRFNLLARN